MASTNLLLLLLTFSLLSLSLPSAFPFSLRNLNLSTIQFPSPSFNPIVAAAAAAADCNLKDYSTSTSGTKHKNHLKLHLKHRPFHHPNSSKTHSIFIANRNDLARLHRTLSTKNTKSVISTTTTSTKGSGSGSGSLTATLESGVSLGSGEYFIDVFVGTPPARFSLILDTGSDLNWLQCLPCHDCFQQHGPLFDPASSTSYRNITCNDPRCALVSPPPQIPNSMCHSNSNSSSASCPYYYWYGDKSNTTGDLALEAFTLNLTTGSGSHTVDPVIFGCGHWNRGLFHGAAGLLGLGRGPLSFASQLRELYGHTFSYCLVDRNSDLSVSSKLIFGEDQSLHNHPNLNYTGFAVGKENPADTFYYVQVKGVRVGGESVEIPSETWNLNKDGSGGTIVDSGTTLSYFADAAYGKIREEFLRRVKYPVIEEFPVLSPCYNVSGVEEKVEMPGFSIVFGDGAVWDFPVENYFIRLEPEGIMCLAILGTPASSLSIIGNYQQQNFHVLYDTKRSRLGFAPMKCADV